MSDLAIGFNFLIWIGAGLLQLAYFRRNYTQTVGLTLIYTMTLAQSYGLVPLIYYNATETTVRMKQAFVGYQYSTIGLGAFIVGSIFIAPHIMKNLGAAQAQPSSERPNLRLPLLYITLSMVGFFGFDKVPTLLRSSLAVMWFLLPAGIILLIWHFMRLKQFKVVIALLILSLGLPLFTGFLAGFFGAGAIILISVVLFMLTQIRIPWRVLIVLTALAYIGVSAALTYYDLRRDLRAVIWSNSTTHSRSQLFSQFWSDFQWFDIRNPEQVRYFEIRVNQSYIPGAVVQHMKNQNIPFANGNTLSYAIIGLIPRAIWANKPVLAGGNEMVSYYSGLSFGGNTSIGIGHSTEFYLNFGTPGMIIGCILMGILLTKLDYVAARALHAGNLKQFVVWYMVGSAFVDVGAALSICIISAIQALILISLINRFLVPLIIPPTEPERINTLDDLFRLMDRSAEAGS